VIDRCADVTGPLSAGDEQCHGVPRDVTPQRCQLTFPKEDIMPSANRMTTAAALDAPQIEGRYATLGDYTVSFETFRQDADPAPYFAGLPDDRCQCAHWGVVTAGQLTFRWPDHDETYVAGDAYYAPPGHLPLVAAGATIVEFSPTADLEATMAVVERNLAGSSVSP
jgi:hypothetical protein